MTLTLSKKQRKKLAKTHEQRSYPYINPAITNRRKLVQVEAVDVPEAIESAVNVFGVETVVAHIKATADYFSTFAYFSLQRWFSDEDIKDVEPLWNDSLVAVTQAVKAELQTQVGLKLKDGVPNSLDNRALYDFLTRGMNTILPGKGNMAFLVFNYETGVFEDGETILPSLVRVLMKSLDYTPSVTMTETIIADFRSFSEVVNPELIDRDGVAVRDGFLNFNTLEIESTAPNQYVTRFLDVSLSSTDKALNFEQYLLTTFDTDEEREAAWIYLGSLFDPYRFQYFVFLAGTGRNGKGIWTAVAQRILRGFVSGKPLQDANSRWFLEALLNANGSWNMANISSENRTGNGSTRQEMETIKKLTGGRDVYSVEVKNVSHKQLYYYGMSLVFVYNDLPQIEMTHAVKSRLRLIKFEKQFDGSKRDPKLTEKVLTEIDAIATIAFAKYKAFVEAGHTEMYESPKMAADKAKYFGGSDNRNAVQRVLDSGVVAKKLGARIKKDDFRDLVITEAVSAGENPMQWNDGRVLWNAYRDEARLPYKPTKSSGVGYLEDIEIIK